MMNALYKEIADLLLKYGQCVALSGAGISAESGIPTFRSKKLFPLQTSI